MTREQKISLLHELIEHAVVHRGLRADLHQLIVEIPRDPMSVVVLKDAS
jgi:hypothetical protein